MMSETASLAVTPSAQRLRFLLLQSGSISLLTFIISLLLFYQPCITSCFESSTGCEGIGKIPVRVCYLVAGYGKLSVKATAGLICQWRAVVLQEGLTLHSAHLHCLQTSQGRSSEWTSSVRMWLGKLFLPWTKPAFVLRGGKSHRRKHSQLPWSLPTAYFSCWKGARC